ncbi:MAG: proton-conducting transporter membrane subunit [Micromonosporaceae bacterium]
MDTVLLLAPIGLSLLAAAGHGLAGWRRTTGWAGVAATALLLGVAVALAVTVQRDGPVSALGGLLRADALSGWMLLVVGAVALLACWASPSYLAVAHAGPAAATTSGEALPANRARWYGILLHLFIAAMSTAVLAGNLGLLWVAIEATTIVTAFLVGHHRSRTALEAAWKYVVICSAAIAIAFLGTMLLYYAARHAGLSADAALDWRTVADHAGELDPSVTRIAIGLAVLGFGAKAGLVPLHAWLPDAHSQAPAPISALMSGVLLSVAFYAVLRFKAVADAALGVGYLRGLLLVLALATLALAAVLLLGQRDYKRMLAYSSMEHMALLAVGAAAGGPLAISAVLLHIAGHGLAKSVAFLGSGHLLRTEGTTEIAAVRGLAGRTPLLAGVYGLAVLALLGLPPSAVFASQLGIARAGFTAGIGWAVAVALLLALVGFAAIAARTSGMLLGSSDSPTAALSRTAAAPLVTGLVAVAALGVAAWPLTSLLYGAASVLGATP